MALSELKLWAGTELTRAAGDVIYPNSGLSVNVNSN